MEAKTDSIKNTANTIIFTTIGICLGYAILRYHILGPVSWKSLPLFIFNKAISLASIILLTLNFSIGPLNNLGIRVSRNWLDSRMAIGMTGFLLVFIHALISFLLISPNTYPKFFEPDNTITLMAGISMLGGILSFIVLWIYNLSFKTFLKDDKALIKFITSRKFLLFAMLLAAIHIFFMGYEGWFKPSGWHAGLPPISLVAFTFFLAGYIINIFGRK